MVSPDSRPHRKNRAEVGVIGTGEDLKGNYRGGGYELEASVTGGAGPCAGGRRSAAGGTWGAAEPSTRICGALSACRGTSRPHAGGYPAVGVCWAGSDLGCCAGRLDAGIREAKQCTQGS
jgi:hypothetical protein